MSLNKLVLVVDHDIDEAKLLHILLTRLGLDCLVVFSHEEAFETVWENPVNLILIRRSEPTYALCHQLKSNLQTASIPIILLCVTHRDEDDRLIEVSDSQVFRPWHPVTLTQMVKSYLE